MNRPPLAPDLLGVIEQAEQELETTIAKLDHGEAATGRTGMQRARLILSDARAREAEREDAAA